MLLPIGLKKHFPSPFGSRHFEFRLSPFRHFPLRATRRHLASRCHRVLPAGDVPLDLADFSHVVALVPLHSLAPCQSGDQLRQETHPLSFMLQNYNVDKLRTHELHWQYPWNWFFAFILEVCKILSQE